MNTHPQIDTIINPPGESFSISRHECYSFYNKYHLHHDFEITFIEKGAGQRWVCDHAEPFEDGDLVMTGAWMPHVWLSNSKTDDTSAKKLSFVLLQFNESSLGKGFFDLPEMQKIKALCENSARGLKIYGETAMKVVHLMNKMLACNGCKKIVEFLELLHLLSLSTELLPLASETYTRRFNHNRSMRVNNIHLFLLQNIDAACTLEQIARHAGMNKSSLCRYFKEETGKTLSDYYLDLKIQYACILLKNTKTSIKEIAFQCGFSSPSYFNRQFRKLLKITPKEFKQGVS